MSVSLKKGESVNLTKESDALSKVQVGLGWDMRTTTGPAYDLDASAIACGTDGKVISDDWFICYAKGHDLSPDGTIQYGGDNLTGEGEGDDETITIDLSAIAKEVERIVFIVSIYEADERKQHFGDVANSYIRVVDLPTGKELTNFNLREDYEKLTALVVAEVYRKDAEWKFRAIGDGYASGLKGIATDYGVHVKADV